MLLVHGELCTLRMGCNSLVSVLDNCYDTSGGLILCSIDYGIFMCIWVSLMSVGEMLSIMTSHSCVILLRLDVPRLGRH